jgi:hypothetical protein
VRSALKQFIFKLLRKDPEAIVVTFASGDPELAQRMFAEIQSLVPDRRHILVEPGEFGVQPALRIYGQLRKRLRAYRIGQVALLLDGDPRYTALRRAAFLYAPTKILAYNARLERRSTESFFVRSGSFRGKRIALFIRPRFRRSKDGPCRRAAAASRS